MLVLQKSLKKCGYRGLCENEKILRWAIRTGACSHFYNDLLAWLETHLTTLKCTQQVRTNITNLFDMLRRSILMIPHLGSEMATNPKEFRLQTLKVLVHQLELSKMVADRNDTTPSPNRDLDHTRNVSLGYGRQLSITLNMEKRLNSTADKWNERLVRYSPDLIEMYQ